MKGILLMLSRSPRKFTGTTTYDHMHNALNTCDSKLHPHGNHYQEKWGIKACIVEREERGTKLQQDRDSERETEGGGQRDRKVLMPKG